MQGFGKREGISNIEQGISNDEVRKRMNLECRIRKNYEVRMKNLELNPPTAGVGAI